MKNQIHWFVPSAVLLIDIGIEMGMQFKCHIYGVGVIAMLALIFAMQVINFNNQHGTENSTTTRKRG